MRRYADTALVIAGCIGLAFLVAPDAIASPLVRGKWTLASGVGYDGSLALLLPIGVACAAGPALRLTGAAGPFAALWLPAVGAAGVGVLATVVHFQEPPPHCNCASVIRTYERVRAETGLIAAVSFVVAAGFGLLAAHGSSRIIGAASPTKVAQGARGAGSPGAVHSGGFTLLELLAVVGIIGILIAIVVPVLGKSRFTSMNAQSLSNLRQHVQVFTSYTSDYQSLYPYLSQSKTELTYVDACGYQDIQCGYHFHTASMWIYILADGYYDGDCQGRSFYHPAAAQTWLKERLAGYYYSSTMMAHPDFWNPATRTGPDQWMPISSAMVQYPAQKGILWEWMLHYNPDAEMYFGGLPGHLKSGTAFCDGHVADVARADFTTGYPSGEGNFLGSFLKSPWPTVHTIDGVYGRDLK